MPQFDEEQTKEIQATVRKLLGLEEKQSLAEVLETQVNDTLNRYDRRLKKDREKADEELNEKFEKLTESIGKLGDPKATPPADNPPKVPEGLDLSKLPEGVRQLITTLNSSVEELKGKFERSETARVEEEKKRKEVEAEREAGTLRNAVRDTLLNRESVGVEYDADGLDMLVREIAPRVRRSESGIYEFDSGKRDSITQDPVFKPLADGLKEFSATGVAKKFQRSRAGTPPGTPPGTAPGVPEAGKVPASQLANMKPHEIDKLAAEGKIDFSQ